MSIQSRLFKYNLVIANFNYLTWCFLFNVKSAIANDGRYYFLYKKNITG